MKPDVMPLSRRRLLRASLGVSATVATLAACGGAPAPTAAPATTAPPPPTAPATTAAKPAAAAATPAGTAAPAAGKPSPATTTAAAKPTAAAQALKGKITFYAHRLTPTDSMVQSPNNPIPHKNLRVISDEYQDMHPGVTIEIVKKPTQQTDRQWMVTVLSGDTAPTIIRAYPFDIEPDLGKGWWIPLTEHLNQPNPYVEAGQPGSQRWYDQFYENFIEPRRLPDGNLYVVPYDLVTTFFYYNQDLFAQHGVTPPKTYAEFKTLLQTLKDNGVEVPYNKVGWYDSQLGQMAFANVIKEVKPGGGVIVQADVAKAIQNGLYRATRPEYKGWLELVKALVPYVSPDWPTPAVDWYRKFVTEQVAILEDGSWTYGLLQADPLLKFKWATFFAPTLTKDSFELATGQDPPTIGGASDQFAISKTATRDNTLEASVDYLRFLCKPANASRILGELGQTLPNIKGVEVAEFLKEPLQRLTRGIGEAEIFVYGDKIVDSEVRDKIGDAREKYYLGQADLDTTIQAIDQLLVDYAAAACQKFPQWNC